MAAEARLKSKNLYKVELYLLKIMPYAACKYLNVSRATFDNYVRSGKLPRGEHEAGFKELSWNKKTLDEFIRRSKHEK